MNNLAFRIEGLSKQYRIGRKQEKYKTLRDTVTDALTSPFRRARKLLRGQSVGAVELDETIWALKDICLEIKHGEVFFFDHDMLIQYVTVGNGLTDLSFRDPQYEPLRRFYKRYIELQKNILSLATN